MSDIYSIYTDRSSFYIPKIWIFYVDKGKYINSVIFKFTLIHLSFISFKSFYYS